MKRAVLLVAATFLVSNVGCAGWKSMLANATAIGHERKQRDADAIRTFDEHRDAAQLQAALDRWQQGDVQACERYLTVLAQRRPDFADARLHLGELLWSRGESGEAETHLRAALSSQPNRADVHHALALLLDGTGRSEEARAHFLRAVELEPENEIYQLTCESLPAPGSN